MKFEYLCRFEDYLYARINLRGKDIHAFFSENGNYDVFPALLDETVTEEEEMTIANTICSLYPYLKPETRRVCDNAEDYYMHEIIKRNKAC